MKWSSNNRACLTVWSTLMVLDQISESQAFKETGQMKINELKFFPQDGGGDIKDVRVNSLALQLDKTFRLMRGATYEVGVKQAAAVKAMAKVLADKDKTIADLADKSDDKYLFNNEGV